MIIKEDLDTKCIQYSLVFASFFRTCSESLKDDGCDTISVSSTGGSSLAYSLLGCLSLLKTLSSALWVVDLAVESSIDEFLATVACVLSPYLIRRRMGRICRMDDIPKTTLHDSLLSLYFWHHCNIDANDRKERVFPARAATARDPIWLAHSVSINEWWIALILAAQQVLKVYVKQGDSIMQSYWQYTLLN